MDEPYFGEDTRQPTWEEAEAVLSYRLRHPSGWRRSLFRACAAWKRGGLEGEPHAEHLISIYEATCRRYLRYALNHMSGTLLKYRGFNVSFTPTPRSPYRFVAYGLPPDFVKIVAYSTGEMREAIDAWHRLNWHRNVA